MVKAAKHEILLVLPTTNAFYREERIGIIELLQQTAQRELGVNVRILTPTTDIIEEKLQNMVYVSERRDNKRENREEQQQMRSRKKSFDVRPIHVESTNEDKSEVLGVAAQNHALTTVTILVVDREESLVIEKKTIQSKIL